MDDEQTTERETGSERRGATLTSTARLQAAFTGRSTTEVAHPRPPASGPSDLTDPGAARRALPASPAVRPGALPHLPALDGLRGLAVAAVVLYHAQIPWAQGGFLGVSTFFTLSGFLITALMLREHDATSGLDLRRFWARRFRRLAPASLVTIAAILLIGGLAGITAANVADLRSAALYSTNWWFLNQGDSYAAAFQQPSPVEHFWSLAIEEQFYLLLPLLCWGVLRRTGSTDRPRRHRRVARRQLTVVFSALFAASLAAQLVATDTNRIYLGTDTRASELLAGCLLAMWWTRRPAVFDHEPMQHRRTDALAGLVGLAAVGTLAWLVWSTRLLDEWLYQGGFAVVALVSVGAIMAATRPGPASRLLSIAPLRHLGRVSYGVYLLHWPLFLWIDTELTGLTGMPLLAVRMVPTLALAELSFRVVEQPIRTGRWPTPGQGARVVLVAMAAVVAATILVPTTVDRSSDSLAALAPTGGGAELGIVGPTDGGNDGADEVDPISESPPAEVSQPDTDEPASTTPTTAPVPAVARPVLALAGDSVPALLAQEIGPTSQEHGYTVLNLALEACDGARGAPVTRFPDGRQLVEPDRCTQWATTWPQAFDAAAPDAVVFMLGGAAILDREVDGRWTDICQTDYQQWYQPELLARVDWLAENTSAQVVVATSPWAETGTLGLPVDHQQRTDCLNQVVDATLQQRPHASRIDIRSWLCPTGPDSCQDLRSDGIHYRGDGARALAAWLVPAVEGTLRQPVTRAAPPGP